LVVGSNPAGGHHAKRPIKLEIFQK
jgi:hypothetical protein